MSKDIKKMVAEIRGALDGYPREQLQEILAWVFKEYVVEGGAAPAQGALAMLDARTELEGLSFAELVTWLQLHLDVPELAALEVQGGRVSLRAGGRAIAIEVARAAPEPAHAAAPVAAPPSSAPPSSAQPSSAPPSSSPPSSASPSSASSSVPPPQPIPAARPTPSTPASSPQPMPPPNAATPSSQTPPAAPANQPASEEKKDDNPSSRFSWLEVD